MLAKWVIVAFMSVSAIFASDVRAAQSRLDNLIFGGKTSESLRTLLLAVHQKLGVDLDTSEWILNEESKKIERALEYLNGTEFEKLYPLMLEKCGLTINRIYLGTSLFVSRTELTLDLFDARLGKRLAGIPARCESVKASIAWLDGLAAPRTFTVDIDRVLSGRADSPALALWVAAVKNTKFLAALDDYGRECRQDVRHIKLDFHDRYSRVAAEQTFNLDVSPALTTERLFAAAAACRQVLPALAEFSSSIAAEHGLIFSTDAGLLYEKRVRPAKVLAWLDYFKSDPRRLDSFRDLVLKSAQNSDYPDIRKCQADATKTAADCSRKLIAVSLTTYTSISDAAPVIALLFFLGEPILATLAALDSVSNGSIVNIDSTEDPHDIETIK